MTEDSARQYIDLFEQHAATVDSHAPALLNSRRADALAKLKELGLPSTDVEAYAHTDVSAFFAPDYGLNLRRLDIPVNPYEVFRCDVPNLSTYLYFMVNDTFYTKEHPAAKLPDGVFAGSLREFATHHADVAERYYDRLAAEQGDGAAALNTLYAQDGFVLYVPRGVRMEKPIQLINVLRSDVDFLVNRRLLVIVEAQAEAKLLVCDHALDSVNFLANQVAEIYVEQGGYFDYYELEENTTQTKRVASTLISQAADSNVLTNSLTLTNGHTRNTLRLRFEGQGAEAHLTGMVIADGQQHVDNHTFIDHAVPHCHSNELFKYVLDGDAVGSFAGRILVREGAEKTEAYQSNKNLVATKTARMFTRPELEIYADDVKCSHGATVGQHDSQALFYLRSRGIPEAEAKMLLMYAFSADVLDLVRLEPLKERLRNLVEKRFRGELAKCRDCGKECK
jgi:Fe-S cluster assembly protein SufD